MNIKAFLNTISSPARSLPIVIIYVTEGCNLKCVTCSYRQPLPNELTFEEITELAGTLAGFGLKHIVYSGGEPLLRRDFPVICRLFAGHGVKQTLLTNGLLLEKRIDDIREYFDEIIVSIDGAEPDTHNKIRGVNSFDLILKGIAKTLTGAAKPEVSIRTVLQKQNFRELEGLIELAKRTGISRISFLAADVSSDAYGRDTRGAVTEESRIAPDQFEIKELRNIIDSITAKYENEFASGLISESPEKLHHIADYYEALASGGKIPFPKNLCNAPMVSAVITSTGDIHPCFFLPSYGNIRKNFFSELINSPSIISTRKLVKKMEPLRCKECVCTLYTSPKNAMLDNF